jgi:Tetratricopeptide repeat
VASRLITLAHLLQATDRLAEAEPLIRRALAIDDKSYGPDHPEVATDLAYLARLLHTTNRLADAQPLTRRVLLIFETSLGQDHPHTVAVRYNLVALEAALAQGGS